MKKRRRKNHLDPSELVWGLVAMGAAAIAGAIVKRSMDAGWRAFGDEEPPELAKLAVEPWGRALTFAAVSALAAGVATLALQKGAASGWERLLGEPPPV